MASIADVYVAILPETGKIANGIKTALLAADKHVKDAAERWRKEIQNELDKVDVKVNVKVDKAKAEKEIEKAAEDKEVLLEPKVDKGSAAKAEGAIDAVARDRTAKVKVKVDQSSLAKAGAQIRKSTGFAKGTGLQIPGARGTVPPALGIEAIGAAPAVVPLISSIVQSVGQLSGALGLIPAAAGAAALAIGTLKIGFSGFGDAIKEIGDPEKFAEAIKQLAPSAQAAATAIQGLMPQITQLKMTVQGALFAGLGEEFGKLGNTYLPIFQTVMGQMAVSANNAFKGISKQLQTPQMQEDIKTFGKNAAEAFDTLMLAAQPFVKALSDIMVVGSSFLPQLAATVGDLATRFANFIENARESGKLAEWIQGGITAFTQLKDIAVNVWNIFKGIFQASDVGDFLETVVRLTDQWATWVGSLEGQTALKQFFDDAKESAQRIWDLIVKWGPVLYNAFLGMKGVVDQVLPIVTKIGEWLQKYPGFVQTAGVMFAGWKLASILGDIAAIGTAILGLGGKGAVAGAAAGAGLRSGILAGFGGSLTIPIVLAATVAAVGTGFGTAMDRGLRPDLTRFPEVRKNVIGRERAAANEQSPEQIAARRQGTKDAFLGGSMDQPKKQTPRPAPGQVNRVQPPNAPPQAATPDFYQPPAPSSGGGGTGGSGGSGGAPEPVAPAGMSYDYTGYGDLNWDALAELEAGGNPKRISPNGVYKGLYQFDDATWRSVGGDQFAPTADQASEDDQQKCAQALYNSRGTAPWPVNGWVLEASEEQLKARGLTKTGRRRTGYGRGGAEGNRGGGYGSGAPQPREPYGLPGGTNTGGYGSGGQGIFPQWVQNVGQQFGIKPSTYPGHQTSNVNKPGFAPNPQGLNRGIDWTGTPEQMRQFAQWAMEHPEQFEQLIYQEPGGGKAYEIYGGQVRPGTYGAKTLSQHGGAGGPGAHVHTRSSQSFGPDTTGDMSGQYSYDGPGGDRGDPMYVKSTDTSGEQLGKDIVSGVMEIFGFGDLFKDPTQFGLFKIFKSIMGIRPGEANGGSTNADGGTGNLLGGNASATGNPLIDMMSQFVPGGTGNSIADDIAAWQPAGGGTGGLSGIGGITDDVTNMIAGQGPTNITNNRNITVEGNATPPTVGAMENRQIADLRNKPGG